MSSNKKAFLEKQGLLNPKPERVSHPRFDTLEFFDPLDLPQVRYEMLRTARAESRPVAEACGLFGFSREYFYRLERAFSDRGYVALLCSPRGRRPLIALNQDIVNSIVHRRLEDPNVSARELHEGILREYGIDCSLRTVERLVEKLGLEKKGRRSR